MAGLGKDLNVNRNQTLHFQDFAKKEKIWNINMDQNKQLSVKTFFDPMKFIFRPVVLCVQMNNCKAAALPDIVEL